MSSSSGKVIIQVESSTEQEEHQKIARKMLKEVQNVPAVNKENVVLPSKVPAYLVHKELVKKTLFSDPMELGDQKRKKPVQSQSSQTSPVKVSAGPKPTITEEDLTSLEGPSQQYWEVLAEKRRLALEESLSENMELYEKISSLEEELSTSKSMLEEARNLVEVLTEMLQEGDAEKQESAAKGETSKEDDSGVAPEVLSELEEEF